MIKKITVISAIILASAGIILFSIPITRYILVQGYYQAKVILSKKPISKMLKDPKTDEETRKKLMLVGEIKKFGITLGLNNTKSYETLYDTSGQPVIYAVSACKKDRFEQVMWKFPVVGVMPNLGFFNKKDAEKEFDNLKSQDLDVLMRPVSAFSSIGILSDPLYSSMLSGSEEYLANTIIHEMTHETVFIKNDMDFNESLASFVGNQGGIDFIKHKYGENSRILKDSANFKKDDEIFSEFMANLYDRLDALYKQPVSRERKLEERRKIFEKSKETFKKEIKPRLLTNCFDYFENLRLNNAYILFNRRYHKDYNVFDDLYRLQGNDIKKTISFLKSIKGDKDIKNRINQEIETLNK